MATDQDQRPRYYEDQYLGADDLNLAIEYGRTQDARHALGGHTWGIALGLELREKRRANGDIDVFVSPGYAWDGLGRPIILLEPVLLSANFFQDFSFTPGLDDDSPEGRLLAVWIRYDEQTEQDSVQGFASCDSGGQQRRIRETSRLEVTAYQDPLQGRQDAIVVNGTSVAAQDGLNVPPSSSSKIPDESIPFQIFPASEDRKRWPIPLGLVRWKPSTASQAGKFIERNPVDLQADEKRSLKIRRYIGVIAESVQSAGEHIRVKKRTDPNSSVWTNDLLWVEGPLRVDADARLLGGALHFRDRGDDPKQIAAIVQRKAGAKTELQIVFEKPDPANNRKVEKQVVIRDDGQVGMGVANPTGRLTLKGIKDTQGLLTMFSDGADIEYDGGSDKLFIFKHSDPTGKTAFMGGDVGIGTPTPNKPLVIRAVRQGEELIGFEDPQGQVKWHLNQNLGGVNPGLNVAETGVADGRLFIQARTGNVGIGTTDPKARVQVTGGAIMPAIGNSSTAGIQFPSDPGGGSGDEAFIRYFVESGETTKLLIGCNNDADDRIGFYQFGGERMTIYNGNVEIGTTNPEARLDIVGTLRVGRGTNFTGIQAGTASVERSPTTRRKTISVSFPRSFTSVPKVVLTVRGGTSNDFFAVKTTQLSSTGFNANVMRMDTTGGWNQSLQIDWFAWE